MLLIKMKYKRSIKLVVSFVTVKFYLWFVLHWILSKMRAPAH